MRATRAYVCVCVRARTGRDGDALLSLLIRRSPARLPPLFSFFSSSFLVSHAALRVRVRVAKLSEKNAARAYAHTSTANF